MGNRKTPSDGYASHLAEGPISMRPSRPNWLVPSASDSNGDVRVVGTSEPGGHARGVTDNLDRLSAKVSEYEIIEF